MSPVQNGSLTRDAKDKVGGVGKGRIMKNFTSHVDDFGHRTQEELENQTDLLDFLGCSLGNRWE